MITAIKILRDMNCLVIEDTEERIKWFTQKLPYFDAAETPDGALEFFKSGRSYDIIFLDHDCRTDVNGVRRFVEPTDPDFLNSTFWRVAQYLHHTEYKGQVVIHSGNPVGAKRMEALLGSVCKVAVIPFGQFDIEVTDEE